jgi:hypothetical protein
MRGEGLADGRRAVGVYDFGRDWWVAHIEGCDRVAEGHSIHAVLANLFDVPRGVVSPDWLLDAADRLPGRETPLGTRVMCRCFGYQAACAS